jgi:zinc protease
VRDFLRTYITRGNVMVAASGDVDGSVLDAMLEPVVDALADNDSGAVAVTQTTLAGSGETLRQSLPVPQTTVLFAAPAIARDDPRFYAQYLLNYILGGSALFSRLGDEVRQKKGLVYSIDTDLDMKRGAALITGSLATRNATAEEAVAQVKSVLDAMYRTGATTQECEDAKNHVLGAFTRMLDGSSSVTNMLMAMQIHRLGEDYIANRAALFGKVSCGDINAVASEILNPANFLFVVVGGSPEIGGTGPIPVAVPAHSDVK